MDRGACIEAILSKHGYSRLLRGRIEDLLDGRENPAHLHCCASGCYVCVETLRLIVSEVAAATAKTTGSI